MLKVVISGDCLILETVGCNTIAKSLLVYIEQMCLLSEWGGPSGKNHQKEGGSVLQL